MAIDFISENINDVPLCELEIFMEIFEKQCNFFDRVISLQTKNHISTNRDYFANRQSAIQNIKREITKRRYNREHNGKEQMCDFIFDINLSFLVLIRDATAISPKLCQYIDRYNNYFCKRVVEVSRNIPASKYKMSDILPNGKYYHPTYEIDYGDGKDESVRKIVPRKKPFLNNNEIIEGLRKEYQEKYKNKHTQIINNNLTDKNIIGNKISNDDTINKEDHKSKANYTYNIYDSNNSSSEQQKVDVGNINMDSH